MNSYFHKNEFILIIHKMEICYYRRRSLKDISNWKLYQDFQNRLTNGQLPFLNDVRETSSNYTGNIYIRRASQAIKSDLEPDDPSDFIVYISKTKICHHTVEC